MLAKQDKHPKFVCMEGKYVCIDEKFYVAEDAVIKAGNRAFNYGDALFETIHCLGTTPQFIARHVARLRHGMKALKMQAVPELDETLLSRFIEKLLNKNRIFKGARIRLTVFRKPGGRYTPVDDTVSWMMESNALENEQYELNQQGLHVDIFDEVHLPVNKLSPLKTTNSLPYVLAGIYCRDHGLDDSILLNQFGRIAEAVSSNIFLYIDNLLLTPPLSEGCIAGTMRSTVLGLAVAQGYRVEERKILETHLHDAEEVFLTNAIQGISWVGAYKDRRYFNFVSRKLTNALNDNAFGA